jgi:hypothetical protein
MNLVQITKLSFKELKESKLLFTLGELVRMQNMVTNPIALQEAAVAMKFIMYHRRQRVLHGQCVFCQLLGFGGGGGGVPKREVGCPTDALSFCGSCT